MTWTRQHVRDYLDRTGWTPLQFLRGVRTAITNEVVAERTLREFLMGAERVHERAIGHMLAFVDRFPDPGLFREWEHRIAAQAKNVMVDEDRQLQARRDAVEHDRAQHRAALLAAERAPRTPSQPWCPSQRLLTVSTPREIGSAQ
ncbi:MAG TPA: hypothetical protein VF463_19935 [Sphingobium sp.]